MKKHLVIGMTAFVLMTGGAIAQETPQAETSTTRTQNSDGSVQVKKKAHTEDANGVKTDQTHTYSADDAGAESKSVTETNAPDGTSVRTKKHTVTAPNGDSETHTTTSKEKW